jgi:translation initiation factor IF-3
MTMVLGPTKKKTEVVAEQKAAKAAKAKATEEASTAEASAE